MTNPYSMGGYPQNFVPQNMYQENPYGQNMYQNNTYSAYPQGVNRGPSLLGMMTLGGTVGGGIGYFKNRRPVSSDGTVSDSFAKAVFDKRIKTNGNENSKTYFKQLKNVLKEIDKIKTPEKYKALLTKNKDLICDQCKGFSIESYLSSVDASNLNDSKKALKDSLNSIMNLGVQNTKAAIKKNWDTDKKKFIQSKDFNDDKLFKIIKNTNTKTKWKKAGKFGAIGASVLGVLTLGYKIFTTPIQR